MITVRKSEDRRHVRSRAHDTWMTFDPSRSVDPFRNGFHALETLNEELLAPEMALFPHAREDVETLTYVQEGRLIRQEASGRLGHLEAGEFQRAGAPPGGRLPDSNAGSVARTRVFQSCLSA